MANGIEKYTLSEMMQKIEEVINQNPGPIEGMNVIYQFNITGDEEGGYTSFR